MTAMTAPVAVPTAGMAKPVNVQGVVQTVDGKPLARAGVRLSNAVLADGAGYPLATMVQTLSDEQGKFELAGLPEGFFQVSANSVIRYHQRDWDHVYHTGEKVVIVMVDTGP